MTVEAPEILEQEASQPVPQHRPVNLRTMPTWRKAEIAAGLVRGIVRGFAKPPRRLPIIHSGVKIRKSNGTVTLGKFCEIHSRAALAAINATSATPARLTIGDMTSIWFGTVISARHEISIGEHCAISWNCTILDNDMHEILFRDEDTPRPRGNFVRIEDHVWIGAGSTVLRGVTIGTNSVVAAGSIVTRDVPPNSLVAGAPAKVIKQIKGWR